MNTKDDSLSSPTCDDGLRAVSPDFVEQNLPWTIDNIVPTHGYQMTPMVGIGGSAGSIQAMSRFFKAMPSDSGMVFVVILHLSPNHPSAMAEVLARSTRMPVMEARDGQEVQADHVYKGDAAKEAHLARTEGRAENERWHARKDGSLLYGSASVMPLRGNSDGLCGFVKIMRDLTERKRSQEALRQQMDELTRFNKAAVGRESRMVELKKEINELCARLNEQPRYSTDFEQTIDEETKEEGKKPRRKRGT